VLVEQYIGVLLRLAESIHGLERGRVKFSGPTREASAWLEENGYMAHARTALVKTEGADAGNGRRLSSRGCG